MVSEIAEGGGLYVEPQLYDVVNAPDTAAEVRALERCARRFAARSGPGSRWLEPACGTGRYLRALLRHGRRVTGYDPLPDMLAYAARRLARVGTDWQLRDARFTTPAAHLTDLAPFDVAFCPVNSLRHLRDDRAVLAHFEQIAALLAPDGVYLVGLDLHDSECRPDEDVWESARGRLRVRQAIQYLPPEGRARVEQVVISMMVMRPRGTEYRNCTYPLRTYTEAQWSDLLDRSALRRTAVCDASGRPREGTARLPYQLEVLARR